jgi:transcriptional regulator with XRE-family HTH domain
MRNNHRAEALKRGFGRRLRSARITAGWDEASDFATDIGIAAPAYRRYERGEAWPPIDVLVDITRLTSVTMDHLILGQGKRHKSD